MIIKWYDACSRTIDNDIKVIIDECICSGRELLAINTTYGKILKVLQDVVVVITEESDVNDIEITVIPRSWIISPEELRIQK